MKSVEPPQQTSALIKLLGYLKDFKNLSQKAGGQGRKEEGLVSSPAWLLTTASPAPLLAVPSHHPHTKNKGYC